MNPAYEALTIIFVLVLVCLGGLAVTQGIFTAQGRAKDAKKCEYAMYLCFGVVIALLGVAYKMEN